MSIKQCHFDTFEGIKYFRIPNNLFNVTRMFSKRVYENLLYSFGGYELADIKCLKEVNELKNKEIKEFRQNKFINGI